MTRPAQISLSMEHPTERRFNPYTDNGGTILAIAGADFSVIAGDTRQSEGYSIQTRYAPKVFRLYASLANMLLDAHVDQDRPCCSRREWLCGRRKHVCQASTATTRGLYTLFILAVTSPSAVVSPCAFKGHACPCHCALDPDDALFPSILSVLCIQCPRWHRGRRFVSHMLFISSLIQKARYWCGILV